MNIRIVRFGYVRAVSAAGLAGQAYRGDPVWASTKTWGSFSTKVLLRFVEVGLKIAQGREPEMVLAYAS